MNDQRIKKIINNMQNHGLDQILITSTSSIFYILGKWIDSGERMIALLIKSNGSIALFINELFPIDKIPGVNTLVYNDTEDPIKILSKHINPTKSLGIDKVWPSGFLIRLLDLNNNLILANGSSVIDEVRMIKDDEEIKLMKASSKINDLVMETAIRSIDFDRSEIKFCKDLSDIYEQKGADGFSFDPLIAYGENAAEPHHSSDNSRMRQGDSIILDIGGLKDYYSSDMTRTIFYKKCDEEYKKVYNIVLEANLKAIEKVKPGVTFAEIDNAAREVIERSNYGEYFTHRTGHNIGIDVHEYPDVSSINNMIVQKGMIFSIEPGIYLKGKCGVRIEDLVVVTENSCEVLNNYSKELKIV